MTIPPGLTERYALRAGVHSAVLPDGVMRLFAWPHAESIGALSADETTLLKELAEGPREIADPALRPFVERLFRGGWLKRTLSRGEHDLYTLDPLRRPGSRPAPPDDPVLSRFAAVRRRPSGFVIESPLAWCDVHVHDPALLPDLLEPAGGRAGPRWPRRSAARRLRTLHGRAWSYPGARRTALCGPGSGRRTSSTSISAAGSTTGATWVTGSAARSGLGAPSTRPRLGRSGIPGIRSRSTGRI